MELSFVRVSLLQTVYHRVYRGNPLDAVEKQIPKKPDKVRTFLSDHSGLPNRQTEQRGSVLHLPPL